jgi:hypothetical protein
MNVSQAVLQTIIDTFDSGNLKPSFHAIGVGLLFGIGTDPSQKLTPIVEKMIHDCMRSMTNRLAESGIRAVPVNHFLYDEPGEFTWGCGGNSPASLGEAYRCLPKGRIPACGIVKIQGSEWMPLWQAHVYAFHCSEVARMENYRQKVATFTQRGWLGPGELDTLSPAEFLRLTGRN